MWKPSWAREVPQLETKAEGDQLEDIVIMMGPAVPVLIVDNVYLYATVPYYNWGTFSVRYLQLVYCVFLFIKIFTFPDFSMMTRACSEL
jgi:hypothetical protein